MKIYIAGKVTDNPNFKEEFAKAQACLEIPNNSVLNPTTLPRGMTNADYMRVCFAMIDIADLVVFLPSWKDSPGAKLEKHYCEYTGKSMIDL